MPLYEYKCRRCEHDFEIRISSERAHEVSCPNCRSNEVDKLLGLPSTIRSESAPSCRADGPSCGAPWCRKPN